MYQKLEEYSNSYLSVYADNHRLIFDFKYPRLFHRNENGVMSLGGSFVESSLFGGLTNFFPGEDVARYRNSSISTTSATVTLPHTAITNGRLTVNGVGTVTIPSPTAVREDVIDVKKLVISSKSKFGRFYLIDSGDKIVKISNSPKSIDNPCIMLEMLRFFGQFNPKIYQLAAAAILPKHKINAQTVQEFEICASQLSWTLGDSAMDGYFWSFCFPALRDCQYYEWSSRDQGMISSIVSKSSSITNTLKALRTSRTYPEFLKKSFKVKGSPFIKHIMSISKAKMEYVAGVAHFAQVTSSFGVENNPLAPFTQDDINNLLAQGVHPANLEINKDKQKVQVFKEFILNEDGTRKSSQTMNYVSYSRFSKPYKTEEYYHIGAIRMLDLFDGLIPIDHWFELKDIPECVYSITGYDKEIIKGWLSHQPAHVRKKVFLTLTSIRDLKDAISQLNEYKTPESIPEKLRDTYPDGFKLTSGWSTVREFHDAVSREYNRIKHFEKNKEITYHKRLMDLDAINFGNGFTSELPKETVQILNYGSELHHCVASYADRCAKSDDTIILSINKDGRPHFTLELQKTGHISIPNAVIESMMADGVPEEAPIEHVYKYSIRQFKGLQNKVPDLQEVDFILTQLKDTGLIAEIYEPSQNTLRVNSDIVINNGDDLIHGNVLINNLQGGEEVFLVNAGGINNTMLAQIDNNIGHLQNALQDPRQHDNIHIRDDDGVLANAANQRR